MMRHNGHQETEIQVTDPTTLDDASQEQAGRDFAASFDDDTALYAYYRGNAWLQESQHPRARGFRRYVIQGSR